VDAVCLCQLARCRLLRGRRGHAAPACHEWSTGRPAIGPRRWPSRPARRRAWPVAPGLVRVAVGNSDLAAWAAPGISPWYLQALAWEIGRVTCRRAGGAPL